ncbi:MAG: hypothetical protein F6K47_23235 [Symploca sp. SIO2E6]|nr:hypothetical protein [Symploca sp. SIO2E6]
MASTRNDPQDKYADKFLEAANDWDLERLYKDLEEAKQDFDPGTYRKRLTEPEKAFLRGFLCGYSLREIADECDKTYGSLRNQLTNGLYRYVAKLTGWEDNDKKLNYLRIPQLLEKAGYKGKPVPQPSDYYVERPPIEEQCYEEIEEPGALLRIKAPQGMGKTLLITRILKKSEQQGYRQVYLNLLDANEADLKDLDSFLRWFCDGVRRGLIPSTQLPENWQHNRVNNKKCKDYFEDYLLSQIEHPVVLGMDVVDRIFRYSSIAEEFLSMLRSWHEEAKVYELWQKLRLVMAYSTEVYIPIAAHKSPFNVGLSVELQEFSEKQVHDLVKVHGLDWDSAEVKKLMKLVGGHPYLVGLALKKIPLQGIRIEELLGVATTPAGIYHNHLQRLLENLEKHPKLVAAMQKIVKATEGVQIEPDFAFQLYSMGLVKLNNEGLTPRCKLYQEYFGIRL